MKKLIKTIVDLILAIKEHSEAIREQTEVLRSHSYFPYYIPYQAPYVPGTAIPPTYTYGEGSIDVSSGLDVQTIN